MEQYDLQLDPVFHALADPTRRAVVQRLGQGEASVGELSEPFAMGLPAFLKHISVLEAAGLIETIKIGRVRTCALKPDRMAEAEAWFRAQRDLWKTRYDQLDDLLDSLKGQKDDK